MKEFNIRHIDNSIFINLVQNISEHVASVDANTLVYEFVNDSYVKTFGKSKENIIGSKVCDVIGKTNYEFALPYINQAKSGLTVSYENIFKTVNGDRWFKVNYSPIKDSNGNVISLVVLNYDITDHKIFSKSLQDSEEKFRILFDNSSVGITISDIDGNIIDVNETMVNILGSPSIEFTKKVNIIHFKPLIDNKFSYYFKECITNGNTKEVDLYYVSKWGKQIYTSNYIIPIKDTNGVVNKVYTLTEDITERKQVELKTIKYQKAVESSMASIVITDIDGKIEYANPFFYQHVGYTKEDCLGKNPNILSSNTHDKEYYNKMWDTIKNGKTWEGEFCNKKRVVSCTGNFVLFHLF